MLFVLNGGIDNSKLCLPAILLTHWTVYCSFRGEMAYVVHTWERIAQLILGDLEPRNTQM